MGGDATQAAMMTGWRRWLLPALLVAGFAVFFLADLDRIFSFQMLARHFATISGFVHGNPLAAMAGFFMLYSLTVAFSLPVASLLTLAGGALFGWAGVPMVILAATGGSLVVFIAAGKLLQGTTNLPKTGWLSRAAPFLQRLQPGIQRGFDASPFTWLLVLRLVPAAPFWAVNIIAALLGMNRRDYLLATLFGIAPGSIVYIGVGRGFAHILSRGEVPSLAVLSSPQVLAPLLGLGLLALVPAFLRTARSMKADSQHNEAEQDNMTRISTDICIIGGGSGGLSLAAGAVQMGARVVLFERAAMGGDCLNHGCVPSKTLLAAAKAARHCLGQPEMGIHGGQARVDFAAVKARIAAVIAAIAPHDSVERFRDLGVEVIEAEACFSGKREVTGGGFRVTARKLVIATGASPLIPPISGLDKVPFHTNETIFTDSQRPDHLLIIGGGPIGVEMAQAHVRLGIRVTLVEAAQLLPRDDAVLVAVLRRRLQAEGVQLMEEVSVTSVAAAESGSGIMASLDDGQQISASHLLVAVGRRSDHSRLQLAEAGINTDDRGAIRTDNRLRTSNRHVYAIGDAAGRQQFTHVAAWHAGIVLRQILFRLPARLDERALPHVTYTEPALAQCGMTEAQAQAAGHQPLVIEKPLAENDRGRSEGLDIGIAADGQPLDGGGVRLVLSRRRRLLGVSILGPDADALIQPWCLMLSRRLPLSAMASVVLPYPTLGETSKTAAGQVFAERLFSPPVRRLVRLLLRLPL